jgi:integrase
MALDDLEGKEAKELTALEYERLEDGKTLLDPKRSGLLMRAGGRKGKRWIYRYREPARDNKQVEHQFGTFPSMSVSQARDAWLQLRQRKNDGIAPRGASGYGSAMTMRQLVKLYLDEYSDKTKRPASSYQDKQALARHVLPHYGDMQALEFGRDEAKAIVNKIAASGATRQAIKVRSIIRNMFTIASKSNYEWLPPDHRNPVYNIDVDHRTKEREPVKPETLRQYLCGLDAMGIHGDVLRLQIETFARVSEPAGMAWTEIDLEAGIWYLPGERSKNHTPHKVMLARQTLERLRLMKEASASPYVFPAPQNAARPIDPKVVGNKLAKLTKAGRTPPSYTSHVSRHVGLTWIAEQGQTRDLRDRLINHKPPSDGTNHIYNAAQLDGPAKEWTQRWVDYLTALETDNVVHIGGKAHAG